MQITMLGMILVPLALVWAANPVRLLQLVFVAGIFEAAAAATFGGFGLQPAMVPGLLFITYLIVQYALGMRYLGEGIVLKVMIPMVALMFYAVLSARILPDAFAGRIMVWPQKPDALAPGPEPLIPSFGNVTQTLYLIINIALVMAIGIFVTRSRIPYDRIIRAYMFGGYLTVFLVFWQLANRVAGVPFPEDLLQSNPGVAIVSQSIGAIPRIQGPFSEPAALAVYMSGVALCSLWLSIRGYILMRPNLLLALSIVSVLLSTSTTGIVTLGVGLPLVLSLASLGGDPRALERIGKTIGLLALVGVIGIAPIFVLKPDLVDAVNVIVEGTMNKTDSDSYIERSSMDAAAYDTLGPTYGFGVGWGSFRSSSLIPGLVANSGVFGPALIVLFILGIRRLARQGRAVARGHPGLLLINGFSAALCGELMAALVSAPMITSLVFYAQLGSVIGVLARIKSEAGHPADARS